VIAYQPPRAFYAFYSAIKGFMDPKTVSKIIFIGGDVSEGSENDQVLVELLGEDWKRLTGADQHRFEKHLSPGYLHRAYWPTIVAREQTVRDFEQKRKRTRESSKTAEIDEETEANGVIQDPPDHLMDPDGLAKPISTQCLRFYPVKGIGKEMDGHAPKEDWCQEASESILEGKSDMAKYFLPIDENETAEDVPMRAEEIASKIEFEREASLESAKSEKRGRLEIKIVRLLIAFAIYLLLRRLVDANASGNVLIGVVTEAQEVFSETLYGDWGIWFTAFGACIAIVAAPW